ncbi:hypothetical protein [uncultured Planktomarina sp.]|uniref:hypothetical protein n=1 Tax=uncultured Planktomarina sp. TaxID=1538529 RepID=UPI0032610A5E
MTTISIGSTLHVVAAKPATENAAGYDALTFVEIGEIVSIGAIGDTSEDVTVTKLKDGRTEHFNGAKDGGSVPVAAVRESGDAGQVIVEANANTNETCSFMIVDPNGDEFYFYGRLANVQTPERTASTYEGLTFEMRRNSGTVKVTA